MSLIWEKLAVKYLFVLTPLLLLACNKGPEVNAHNASIEEVAAQAKAALKIEPGLWSSNTEIISIDMPGIKDKALAAQITNSMKNSKATDFSHCVTPAEAEKPSSEMFAGKANGQCKYDDFKMANGRIDATMTCTPQGGTMKMAMNGTYSSTGYDMTMNMTTSNAQMPGGGMSMKAHTKGARTGVCKT
jgi:CCR4-NOT transcriptional regulation complex NOT5 subunit